MFVLDDEMFLAWFLDGHGALMGRALQGSDELRNVGRGNFISKNQALSRGIEFREDLSFARICRGSFQMGGKMAPMA